MIMELENQKPHVFRFAVAKKRRSHCVPLAQFVQDGVIRLSAAQFSALLEGLDWRRVHAIDTPAPVATS